MYSWQCFDVSKSILYINIKSIENHPIAWSQPNLCRTSEPRQVRRDVNSLERAWGVLHKACPPQGVEAPHAETFFLFSTFEPFGEIGSFFPSLRTFWICFVGILKFSLQLGPNANYYFGYCPLDDGRPFCNCSTSSPTEEAPSTQQQMKLLVLVHFRWSDGFVWWFWIKLNPLLCSNFSVMVLVPGKRRSSLFDKGLEKWFRFSSHPQVTACWDQWVCQGIETSRWTTRFTTGMGCQDALSFRLDDSTVRRSRSYSTSSLSQQPMVLLLDAILMKETRWFGEHSPR